MVRIIHVCLTWMDDTVAALCKITHFVSTNVKYVSGNHSLNHLFTFLYVTQAHIPNPFFLIT